MNIEEFFAAVASQDWFYEMSDDGRVYRAGERRRKELEAEAAEDPIKHQILTDWRAHMYSGDPWGTERKPKPELETYQ